MNILQLTSPIESITDSPRDIHLYKLSNVQCTGLTLYYPNVLLLSENTLYLPYNEMSMSFNRKTIYEETGMKFNCNINIAITREVKDPVFFFIYNVENYYHFIYDTLPYLYYYFELKKTVKNCKLLIQKHSSNASNLFSFVKETLDLLDILEEDLLFVEDNTLYSKVYISSSLTHEDMSNYPPNKQIFDIYKRCIDKALSTVDVILPIDKMYVSRRTYIHNDTSNIGTNYTQRRVLKQESQLVEYLKTLNFIEVFPERWSMKEKIFYFSKAKIITGLIGGGMCNLLFSDKNVKSLVICSPYFLDINFRFKYSMEHTQIKYIKDTEVVYNIYPYSNYQRVKILSGDHKDKYAEIVDVYYLEKEIFIKCMLGSETSVSVLCSDNIISINSKDIQLIDKGLNSPFNMDFSGIYSLKEWLNN
jgi:hypothetical protein